MLFTKNRNQRRLKLFLLSVIFVVSGIIVAVFVNYYRILEGQSNIISSIQGRADISIGRVHQTAIQDGVKEWSLNAYSAHYIKAKKEAIFQDVSVTFFLKDGGKIYLTADQGRLKTDSNNIEVTGNVVVKGEGYKLKTEKLHYEHNTRTIFSRIPVKITGDSFDLVANSIFFDLNRSKTLLEGKVRGIFNENITL